MTLSLEAFKDTSRSEPASLAIDLPGGILRKYTRDLGVIQRLSDILASSLTLYVIATITGKPWNILEQAIALFAAMLVAVVARSTHLYGSYRHSSLWKLLRRLALLWACLVGSVSLLIFAFKVGGLVSREQLFLWFISYGAYLAISHLTTRLILRKLREHGRNTRCDGYIGSYEGLATLQGQLNKSSWLGHTIRGELCWQEQLLPESAQIEKLKSRFENHLPDQWIIEEPGDPAILTKILNCLQDQSAPVLLVPRWLKEVHCKPTYYKLGTVPVLELWGPSNEATPLQLRVKYELDRCASATTLVLISPILLLIGLLIKIDSPGPVLFRQRRYGLNGRPFDCLKFRTMRTQENGHQVVQATRNDPRVTRIGAVLRSWNLDELPQLINVLRGEMSLVGPRPHAEAHNEYYRKRVTGYMRRHGLRPGLTGWAQVLGLRGETDTLDKMSARIKADIDYIHHWSLMLDLKIFILTLLHWKDKNAY